MNWIEACRSGRKFRLPEWGKGRYLLCVDNKMAEHQMIIQVEETLREDFEFVEDGPRECWIVLIPDSLKYLAGFETKEEAEVLAGKMQGKIIRMREVRDET